MTKYIENKKVKKNKVNDVPDLNGICYRLEALGLAKRKNLV